MPFKTLTFPKSLDSGGEHTATPMVEALPAISKDGALTDESSEFEDGGAGVAVPSEDPQVTRLV